MFILINPRAHPCDPIEVAAAVHDMTGASGVRIAVSPQAAGISRVADTGVEAWARHMDPSGHGNHTGSTLAEAAAETDAIGTLINHSERRLKLADVDGSVRTAERAGLETYICANNPTQIGAISALGPDSVTVRLPELVGGDISVVTAGPGIVTDAVDAAANADKDMEVYCGTGISTGDDMVTAEELSASDILLVSGVVKADDPCAAFGDLVSGLQTVMAPKTAGTE